LEIGARKVAKNYGNTFLVYIEAKDHLVIFGNHIFDPNLHKCAEKETGETNHVERLFCTVRQWLQIVSRKTLAFSKVLYMHHVVFKVFFVAYNRCVSVEI